MQAQQAVNMNPQAQPAAPQQFGAGIETAEAPESEDGNDIVAGLEEHLNSIPDQQKKFLADALSKAPELVITTLGIVNGPEVYQYFADLYQTHLSKPQPNSAAPQPSTEAPMSPMSQPNQQAQMNPQPQAKATPTGPMGM